MPYYGAPSKGCESCRGRKVKCDGGRPNCQRCAQSGRRCPGYRELGAVIFRDENGRILRRAATKRGADVIARETAAADDGATEVRGMKSEVKPRSNSENKVKGWRMADVTQLRSQGRQPRAERSQAKQPKAGELMLSLGPMVSVRIGANEGVSFFRQEFWWQSVAMHFATWKALPPDLHSITSAFGLAMLSFARRSPSLGHQAYDEYGAALQLANHSLSEPDTAKSDSTLAVVILMSFFEILTGCGVSSMKTWTNHASGAASLISLRGYEQLDRPVAYQLFLEARGMMLTTSILYKTLVPQVFFDYSRLGMEREPACVAHGSLIFTVAAEIANLRAAISNGCISETESILASVDSLELKLSKWVNTRPAGFDCHTVYLDDSNAVIETRCGNVRPYTASYSVYESSHAIHGWSLYRIGRILLGEILLDTLKHDVSTNAPGTAMLRTTCWAVRRIMNQMASDICASVPFSLGLGPRSTDERLGLDGGYMILMPLWVAGCVEGSGHPLRKNAQILFDLIAKHIGITHASLQMGALEHVTGMAEWLDYLPAAAGAESKCSGYALKPQGEDIE